MTGKPILYSFRRCPYAMRARLALLTSGTTCEIREVKLAAKPVELADASAKATVPVLVLPDGEVIDESLDIMHWALARHDPQAWLDHEDTELITTNDGPFKHHLDRYKYPNRYDSDAGEHRAAGLELLSVLDTRLGSAANLCGERPGITDAAIFPFVRQFANTDRDWFDGQQIPALQAWLERHISSDLFSAIMVKLKPWQAGDDPIDFPCQN